MGKLLTVVGGQWGSEAKGHVAAWLGRRESEAGRSVVGVRVGGPNAGHTVYGMCPPDCRDHPLPASGTRRAGAHPWRLRQIPVLAVSNPDAQLVIAAGSEIDAVVLQVEVDSLNAAGYGVSDRLVIDKMATMLTRAHHRAETNAGLTGSIGSTGKGIGAARSDRIWRRAEVVRDVNVDWKEWLKGVAVDDTSLLLRAWLTSGWSVIIEGTQGYGLGLHTEYYPKVTSGDCRAIDFMAQAGVSPWAQYVTDMEVWVVARTKPIRVAGASGDLPNETSWEELGLPEELTTVTQKVRRVGHWDPRIVNDAIFANGGPGPHVHLALTMVDYDLPSVAGSTGKAAVFPVELERYLSIKNRELIQPIDLIGTGPDAMLEVSGIGMPVVASPMGTSQPTVWRDESGPEPAGSKVEFYPKPLAVLAAATSELVTSLDKIRQDFGVPLSLVEGPKDELRQWWMDTAAAEIDPMIAKALEYGGSGTALDLIDIGTNIVRMTGDRVSDYSVAQLTELGIVFYVQGKTSRITAAVAEGRWPSDDTWHDLGVYARMAARVRHAGGWPFKPTD